MTEQLAGRRSTNCGATSVGLELDGPRAVLRVHARWMGQAELEVAFAGEHRVLGSHWGAMVLERGRVGDQPLPLPPSPGALVVEYVRVPEQPSAGAPFAMVLWLHPDAIFDDGTELDEDAYDVPPAKFRPAVEALQWLASPWKLALGSSA